MLPEMSWRFSLVLTVLSASIACGGTSTTPAEPSPDTADASTPVTTNQTQQSAEPPTKGQCTALLDHVLVLMAGEGRAKNKDWTDGDIAKVRSDFHDKNMKGCLEMPRPSLECGMKAKTVDEMREC